MKSNVATRNKEILQQITILQSAASSKFSALSNGQRVKINTVNQSTGFYTVATLAVNGLIIAYNTPVLTGVFLE